MAKGLEIRRRIKSVKNTRSITRAMQMVAASKMRKAQEQALKSRAYAEKALEILTTVSEKVGSNYKHYLLEKPVGKRYLVLMITSNKGLCGSLNTNVVRKAIEFMEHETMTDISQPQEKKIEEAIENKIFEFSTLGKKGRDSILRLGHVLKADFSDVGDNLSSLDVGPLTTHLLEEYRNKSYDAVYIAYTHFVSVLMQIPVVKRVVPLGGDLLDSIQEILSNKNKEAVKKMNLKYEYQFEPSPRAVLDELLPKFVEIQIFQAILEANASEQSARMVAMKNATEAAGELIDDLTLTYNKTRQAAITQEISEIVGGVEAMKIS